ncbi:MAG TPA: FHA domain-containing protein [Candidatus Accumulibacter phosphatis]|nr:MAG: ABC transporter ATP-binding/permease protein [Candidatus Accumulibacter sp. SK-11]HCV13051.1 FHA domain-containing protein [Accumulibacter sp.]HRL74598.1 FHA domain-containing protein [Candidatus Accumulibacter phosphatis]HRQ97072.1 FHA domain-containing protein [Candidatus Accumulibacter phosphatis]
MAKLILSMDGLVLKEIPLRKERVSIGRKAHNDIQIDNMAISGEHAAVVTILNDSFLEDLNSTNGTLVNGQSVRKHFLKDGDVIELGKYKMKYLAEAVSPVEEAEAERSAPFRFESVSVVGSGGAATPSTASLTGVETANLPAAAIRLLSGSNAGHQLQLTKTLTSLGRPGQVAVIARRPQGYFLSHVEGAGFPLLNGQAIDSSARRLENHDLIEIAGVKMEFVLKT